MVLPTNYTNASKLGHNEFNQFDASINNCVVSVATARTDIANTQTGIASTQQASATTQSGITTVQQKTAADATALTALQATLTSVQNRLAVLETASPPPAVPGMPASMTPGTITNTSVAFTLTAPVGGATPTGYTFRHSPAGAGAWINGPSGAGLTGTVTGLTAGTSYDFDAFAFNAAGPGPAFTPAIRRTTTTTLTPSPAWTEMPPATSIVMNDGGVVTMDLGVLSLNGSPMGTTAQVILVVKSDTGAIYQENSFLDWWYWDPTQAQPWVASFDPRATPPVSGESASGTTIPPASQIIMNDGGVVTLTGGNTVDLNGAPMDGTADVNLVLYYTRVVYHRNTGGLWYSWDGSAWQQVAGDPRALDSGVPAPAAAVGYNARTFGPNLLMGSNWFKRASDVNAVQVGNGIRTTGGNNTWGQQMMTATPTSGSTYAGTTFTGGGYYEWTMSFTGAPSVNQGWPSLWMLDIENEMYNAGGTTQGHWQGQAADYYRYSTINVAEWANDHTAIPNSRFIYHEFSDFYGPRASLTNVDTGYNANGSPYTTPAGYDLTQSHKYGLLWVAATASTQGYARWYVDDVRVDTGVAVWNQYNAATAPPPVRGTTAWSFIDGRHMVPVFGTGPDNPLTVTAFSVWQKAANTTSPSGTTIPPASQIIMNNGDVVTLTGGNTVDLNGAPMNGTADVNLVLFYRGVVYHSNTGGLWYSWDGVGNWTQIAGDPRVVTSGNGPPPAAAVGYNTRTLGPQVVVGTNWFKNDNGTNVTTNSDGTVTLAGQSNSYNYGLLSGDGHSYGTAFGGGGYFEIDCSWANARNGTGGWPSMWANSVEGRTIPIAPTWPAGINAGDGGSAIEWDILETFDDGWGPTIWDWQSSGDGGTWGAIPGTWNAVGGVHRGPTDGRRKKVGALWIPATSTTQGRTEYYLDRVLIPEMTITWDLWNSSVTLPLVNGHTSGSIMDFQHFMMIMGTGPANPMTVYSMEIWQRDGSHNLPPTSGGVSSPSSSGTTIPPAQQIIMNNGDVVTLTSENGGTARLNGTPMAGNFNAVLLLFYSGVIYHKNSGGQWYAWDGSDWQTTTDPRSITGGPGTGPAKRTPVNGRLLNNGQIASSDITWYDMQGFTFDHYYVTFKTYFFQGAAQAFQGTNLFNGCDAIFLADGIYLGGPDVPHIYSVPGSGLPDSSGVIPYCWITAGNIGSQHVQWAYYAEDVALTESFYIICDFDEGRGDTFGVTPILRDGNGRVRGVYRQESWGSWIDFSDIGAGWVAFLNYNITEANTIVQPY